MKLLNITVRNIVGLIVIIALAAVMIQLVRGQTRSPQTAQAGPTETASSVTPSVTNPPTAIPQPTSTPTNLESPSLPTIVASPIVTEPYPIFDVTVIPGPTYTPVPLAVQAVDLPSAVTVVENQMLPLTQLQILNSQTDSAKGLIKPTGWTEDGEVIFQKQTWIDLGDGSYIPNLYQVEGTWSISPTNGEITSTSSWKFNLPPIVIAGIIGPTASPIWIIDGYDNTGKTEIEWKTIPDWTPIQQQLARKWAIQKPVEFGKPQYWQAMPDGKSVILTVARDKIYIFDQERAVPFILPKDEESIGEHVSTVNAHPSPDGKLIAYIVETDISKRNEYEQTNTYEIQISNLDGSHTTVINLAYEFGYPEDLAWSPDNKFIAFIAPTADHSPSHVYIVAADASAMTDVTPTNLWATSPLFWSLNGQKIIYAAIDVVNPEINGYWITTLKTR